jgi:putative inorganic carbon (HCO3(-)) transporter
VTVSSPEFRVPLSFPKPLEAGTFTWLAAGLVAAASLSGALISGEGTAFWAAGAATLGAAVFAVRPDVGLVLVILARPVLDVWSNRPVITTEGFRPNIASLMAVTLIVVGGAYVIERWSVARQSPAFLPFIAFASIAAVGIGAAPSYTAAVYEWLRLVSLLVLYAVTYAVVRGLGSPRVPGLAILVSVGIPVAVAVYQTVEGGTRSIADFGRATGTFLHPVPFGIFLGIVISFATPLLLSRVLPLPWLFRLAAPLVLVALVATYTRTAWIGAVVGLLLVAARRHRSLFVVAPLLVVAIAVAVPSTVTRSTEVKTTPGTWGDSRSSVTSRLNQWKLNYPKIQRNPVVGQGLKAIAEEDQGALVHSDYIRAAVETGIFGLAAYLWLLFATLRGSFRSMRRAERAGDGFASAVALGSLSAGFAFVIMSATSNLMTQVVVAGGFWCIAAIGHAAVPPFAGARR